MSILHILWQGNVGGAERAVYQLVQRQKQELCSEIGVAFGQARGPYVDILTDSGVKIVDLSLRSAHDVVALPRLSSVLSAYHLHHFHVAEPLIMSASLLVPGACRVYTYRAGRHHRSGKQALRFLGTRFLVRWGFDGISANTLHGARVAEELFRLPQNSVQVTYNGIDFGLLIPRRSRSDARRTSGVRREHEFLIGTVTNLKAWKRTDWLLTAVAGLTRENWRLVVVGDGPLRRSLELLAADFGIADRISFVGLQPYVADWLVGMDAFVLASSAGESFGNAVVEAMALGVPTIVCSDGGGLLEHVIPNHTGWVADGVESLTRSLEWVMGHPSEAQAIAAHGRAAVRERYTLDNMAAAYNRFYTSVGIDVHSLKLSGSV